MAAEILILAADTGTRHCSVSLCRCSASGACAIAAQTQVDRHRLHAEGLLESLHFIMESSGRSLGEVDCLAVATGPGSFTGLRVGTSAWKGLAFALRKPLVPTPTLDAMSLLNVVVDGIVIPILDARMNEVFGAIYRFHEGKRFKLTSDRVCSIESLFSELPSEDIPVWIWGEGVERYGDWIRGHVPTAVVLSASSGASRADAVAREAYCLLESGIDMDPAHVRPCYLRASQAEQARAFSAALSEGRHAGEALASMPQQGLSHGHS